jgi:hypothetical protein
MTMAYATSFDMIQRAFRFHLTSRSGVGRGAYLKFVTCFHLLLSLLIQGYLIGLFMGKSDIFLKAQEMSQV